LPRAGAAVESAAAPVTEPTLPSGTETILLVEDEEDVRNYIREVLEAAGYRLLEAASAEMAVEVSNRHDGEIHLLLTDVVLPRRGGRELAHDLSASRPDMKVAYMSGYTDNAIVHHGVLDPGASFVQKPIEMDVLLTKVREFLSSSPPREP